MSDMRRTVLWVVFTMSLFFLWDAWNKHNGKPSMFAPAPSSVQVTSGAKPSSNSVVPTPSAAAPAAQAGAALKLDVQTVEIQTDVVKASLSGLGGSLTRVELLQHEDPANPSGHVVVLDGKSSHEYTAQSGLVLSGASDLPSHLSVLKWIPGPTRLVEGADTLNVRFESQGDSPIKLVKTYSFKRGEYAVGVQHEIINTSAAPLSPQLYVQLVRDGRPMDGAPAMAPATFTGPAVYTDKGKFQKVEFSDIDKGKAEFEKSARDGWVAMVQHHFVSAWLEPSDSSREFFMRKIDGGLYAAGMLLPPTAVAAGSSLTTESKLYVGPQDEKKLAALAPGLELVKDYGILTILAKPLFWLLDHLHGYIGNWGWAIVALVVLLKIAFYWLNASAYRSMAKMKAVAPRLTALRERHKNDPQKMQQEMMRIYREEKVNPLGGCLPMLLQMPFFIALYWVLMSSVELRGAPWLAWITDLSAIDPYYILPALMLISQLFQTWLSPRPDDPMQAKLMWFMPVAFGVMFFFFPAGLVLYWLVNNILSIAQQYLINRQMGVLG